MHVDGGMAEYYCHPADMLIKIPEGMSWEQAAMAEPLTISLHGIHRGGLQAGEYCAIIGAGPIGLVAGMVAQAYGAHAILLDLVQERLDFAKSLWASSMSSTPARKIPLSASRKSPAARWRIAGHGVLRRQPCYPPARFDLVLQRWPHHPRPAGPRRKPACPPMSSPSKEIDIRGARTSAGEFEEALDLINSRQGRYDEDPDQDCHAWTRLPDTIVDIEKNPGNYMKVVVRVSNDD